MRTGKFSPEYTEWIGKDTNQKTWAHFKDFWPEKVLLKIRRSSVAQHFGFGGVATEGEIEQGINNFVNAHIQIMDTVNGLQKQNASWEKCYSRANNK